MGNFVGFLAARKAKATWDVRAAGLLSEGARRLRVYTSRETHTWISKATDVFGLGTEAIRWIPADPQLRMDTAALRNQIQADIEAGDLLFLVIGTAGTVSTGAMDPLPVNPLSSQRAFQEAARLVVAPGRGRRIPVSCA